MNDNYNNREDVESYDRDNNVMHQIHKPIMFTNIPVISDRLLKSKVDKLLPIQSIRLKTSDTNLFSYFSHKQLWSSLYDSTILNYKYMTINQYIQYFRDDDDDQDTKDKLQQTRSFFSFFDILRKEVVSSLSSSYDDIDDDNNKIDNRRRKECKNNHLTSCNHDDFNNTPHKYIYCIHSNIFPYLSGIAPGLAQFITIRSNDDDDSLNGKANNDPKVNLWISSANITTALHYDYEDNYLLQIAGKKHITLISPEAIDILSSYPTYHPLWRQSTIYEQIISADQFISYINSKATSSSSTSSSSSSSSSSSRDDTRYRDKNDNSNDDGHQSTKQKYDFKHKHKGNQKIKMKRKQQQQQHSQTRNKIDNTIYGKIKLWDFDLNPGEMVFIPAGYYHIVHTVTDSISVNTCYQSKITENYEKLLLLSLPFHIHDQNITLDMKITQLIFIAKQVYHHLGLNVDVFKNNLQLRFKSLVNTTISTTSASTTTDDDQLMRYYRPAYHRDHICSLDARRMLINGKRCDTIHT